MLPHKRKEPDESDGGRGGFEVHVIGASAPSTATAADDGIEIGLHIGGGKSRQAAPATPEDAPVHRLETPAEPLSGKLKATSEVGPAVPRVSRRSGKKRLRTKHLTLWMGSASCLVAVVAVIAKLAGHRPPPPEPVAETTAPVVSDPIATERKDLYDNFGSLSSEAEQLLKRYAAARNAGEALPMIRNSTGLADRFASGWQPWGSAPAFAREAPVEPAVDEVSPRPAIVIRGRKGNSQPFQYYFVRESGKLLIDWEASEGRGDRTIAELHAGAPATKAIIRASISPATYFTPAFPESSFRSYQLADLTGNDVVWAFVPAESEASRFLKRNLDEGSVILSSGSARGVTLKVTRQPAEGANLFLVTEILHNGWVSP
jgi:hypothetical protein